MKRLFFPIFLLLASLVCQAQLLRQPITNFTPREYGQNVSSYTYSVAEGEDGLIYVGTSYGVLQYDGVSWRFIPIKVGAGVTSINVHKGRVFIGCQGDFGYLVANEIGQFQFKSLASELPLDDSNFSAIWKTLVLNDTIVFQSEERLFLYYQDSITIVNPEESFHLAFVDRDKLYVRERSKGLMAFDGDSFNLVEGGERFVDFGIFAILPYKNEQLLVTSEKGLWITKGNQYLRVALDKKFEKQLIEAQIMGAIKLDDGNYALYSQKGGVFILDSEFNLLANYFINSGMLTSEVRGLIQDRYGNLWAATQKGASRIQYTSPFSIYNRSVGLFGSVKAATKFGDNYLVGTNEGLFISQKEGVKAFEEISSVTGSVGAIESSTKGVWIATKDGLWFYNGNSFSQVNRIEITSLSFIPEKKWIVASGVGGFLIIDELSKEVILNLKDVRVQSYGIAYEMIDEDGVCQIWMGTTTSGVWQFRIKNDLSYSYDSYNLEDGLPPEWVCAYQAGSEVVFATSKGMLRFITPQEIHSLLNDETMSVDDLRGYFDLVDFPMYSSDKAITAFHYNEEESFVGLDYHVNSINMADSVPSNYHLKTLDLGRLNVINKVDDDLLVGGDDGLAIVRRIDKKEREYPAPNLAIRAVTIGTDSLVWHGDTSIIGKTIEIPYSLNSLQVDLASNYFDNGVKALYSWRYKGDESSISRWSSQSNVVLPNLREGDYEIIFLAKNIHDKTSEARSIKFRVLPPWYRTWWAYTLYALVSILLVYAIIQFNIKRLKEQNKKLEEIVKERTREVVEQKEHIEHILQDIQASINYAQRIQQALLPSRELLKEYLPKHFILFHPRDVVSGDFYWATKVDQWVIVTVADCTGHGVPGAFMSMLGISFLNEIVRKREIVSASMILDRLREAVIEALKQTGKQNEQKDGMDMSLVAINMETNICQWAGANNPLYIVRDGQPLENVFDDDCGKCKMLAFDSNHLIEVKGDKMPVAIHTIMENYKNHKIQLLKGDRIFLFTDGFSDQFGGPDYRKFMAKSFKELIANSSNLPIIQQGLEIDKAFKLWMNYNNNDFEQIDDVTVMGIEV